MKIEQEIINVLIAKCGGVTKVKGATRVFLYDVRTGKNSISISKLRTLFQANGIECVVELKYENTITVLKF